MDSVLKNRDVPSGELGKFIKEVIHFSTLRGKFASVHTELRREGIVKIEVVEEGLRFIREGLFLYFESSKLCNQAERAEREGATPDFQLASDEEEREEEKEGEEEEEEEGEEEEEKEGAEVELLRQAIALSFEGFGEEVEVD